MKKILLLLIFMYKKLIGPYLRIILGQTHQCRFEPTCADYTSQAVRKYGFKGLLSGIKRVAKCNPFSKHHWYDPVK